MSYLLYVAAFGEPRAHPRDLPSTPQNSRQVGPIGAPRTPRGSKVQRKDCKNSNLSPPFFTASVKSTRLGFLHTLSTHSSTLDQRGGGERATRFIYESQNLCTIYNTTRFIYYAHPGPPPARPPRAPKDRQGGHRKPQKSTQRPPKGHQQAHKEPL